MKGQMFVVAMVFLVGLILIVQQIMFQYSFLDISEPVRTSDTHIIRSLTENINSTIKSSIECNGTEDSFERYLEELDSVLAGEETGRSHVVSISTSLDCDFWENSPPDENPLNISIRMTGLGKETTGSFNFYHRQ